MDAAEICPAAYWYAMLKLPQPDEVEKIPGQLNGYVAVINCPHCSPSGSQDVERARLPPKLGTETAGGVDALICVRRRGRDMVFSAMAISARAIKYWRD